MKLREYIILCEGGEVGAGQGSPWQGREATGHRRRVSELLYSLGGKLVWTEKGRRMNRLTERMRRRRKAEVYAAAKSMKERDGWADGLLTLWDLLTEWDHYVDHDYCLSDALLSKLNLLPKKLVRVNQRRKR